MASLGDVLSVLVQNTTNAIYPNGLLNPSTAGVDTTIISGWPIRNKIDHVLSSGKALVTVFPTNKVKVVTKFERVFQELSKSIPTITATISGNTVNIGGNISVPQAVMVFVNGTAYSYEVQEADTLDDIANNISLLIPDSSAFGTVISIVGNVYKLSSTIINNGIAAYELSRQERVFLIRCWTTSPVIRDNIINSIDISFKKNYRITLPDDFYGITWPVESPTPYIDDLEKQIMIIGNLEYKVQYATTYTEQFAVIGDVIQNITLQNTQI
jgi:hypothetical protein